MKVRVVLWLIAVVLGAAIGRWTAPAGEARKPVPASAAAAGDPVASVLASTADNRAPPATAATGETAAVPAPAPGLAEAPAADAPTMGFDTVAFLAELPQRLDALTDRARDGDAQALTEP